MTCFPDIGLEKSKLEVRQSIEYILLLPNKTKILFQLNGTRQKRGEVSLNHLPMEVIETIVVKTK